MAGPTLIVFAKPPIPGVAKTRLIPALGATGAARLANALLDHALEQGADAGIGPLRLHISARHPLLARAARRYGARRRLQRGADLGARMAHALRLGCATHGSALLYGTDCPALDATRLRGAAAALREAPIVFVPARDGGFALVGCRDQGLAALTSVFANQAWSRSDVMDRMRAGLHARGATWTELASVDDIDRPADLAHLPPLMHRLALEGQCDG